MKAPGRARRTRLLPRLCVCGLALLAATWLVHLFNVTGSERTYADSVRLWSRRELNPQDTEPDNQTSSTPRAAIHEFPEDVFTPKQRRQGAILLHVLCAVYMFHALAIICDDYFVPSLEKISENLQLSEDVAGATFMAAGSSAPELFTSLIGVFITKGDLGVGTIVGSAVFNILVIIGICGIFSGQSIILSWWPLFRDSVFYILSILVLIMVIYDEKVQWWESIILISMYGIYIIIMKFNRALCCWVEGRCSRGGQACLSSLRRTTAVGHAGDCDTDMVPLKPDACTVGVQDAPPGTADETLHQLSFSERQRLIQARGLEDDPAVGEEIGGGDGGPWANENGGTMEGERQPLEVERERVRDREKEGGVGGEGAGGAQLKEEEEEEEEEDDDEEENVPFIPFAWPERWCGRLRWLVAWPINLVLYCTVPNCRRPRWRRWYLLTFLSSTLWIAFFSYLMVWMVTVVSFTLGIPEVLMGITFLAAGTSVPDCMASLIVARQGMGDMAVSNSIGSNIFDVLLGLGFPWALRTLIVNYGSVVYINSKGLVYSVILLLASVILTVLSVHLNHWRLDRRLGLSLIMLYAVFLLCSVGFERL
ncbi:sodium/potassium/calcium exchanger 3-like [Gadus chalcogrammus]|uniref:sodium/potassium/calcium exchanger 3-like n=1 Tax=Gadus chalcogrammus TaxID=1042646 RepID=UPI0024C4A85B|nr:sodium/potassium/calcium exchanger 3-like [Gadus chalcogrammus]